MRSETGVGAPGSMAVTLQYNTPPAVPTPVVMNYGTGQYEVVRAGQKWEADRDGYVYWAWDDGVADKKDPRHAEWFDINGTRHPVSGADKVASLPDGRSVFRFNAGYGSAAIAAVDCEGVSGPAIRSGETAPPATYIIQYSPNGATGGSVPPTHNKTQYKDVVLATNSGNLTRTGYTFSGWNTQADGNGADYPAGGTYTADASVTLYAKWTANTYTVKFEGNGSDGGNMSDQTFIYDQSQKLTKNGYTRTGYTFAGWQDSDGNRYTDGQEVKNLTAEQNGTITLYAQWEWGESVRDFTELQRLANSSSSTPVTIVLTSDIDFNASNSNSYALEIPSGANVTLRGDGQQRTLQGSSTGWIEVKNGATLTLGPDLVIDGFGSGVYSHWGAVNVDGGTLIMEDGAMIKDLTFGGSVYGAVNVSSGGTFIMNGGEISGNRSNGDAAGVTVSSGGTFIMRGGEITGNKAVYGDGIGADGSYSYYGGGLYISTGGSFTMDGGTISGNYEDGGATPSDVTVENGATFTHNGGTIGQPVEHIP